MAPFYEKGVQLPYSYSHFEEAVYFLDAKSMSMSVVPFSILVEDGIFFPVTYYLNGCKSRLKSLFLVTPCHAVVFEPFVQWSSNEKKIFILKTAFFASILLISFFFCKISFEQIWELWEDIQGLHINA